MKIFITGGTGFVGTHLSKRLLKNGHTVIATGTRPDQDRIHHDEFHYLSCDNTQPGPWQEVAAKTDAAVNLAGRSIFNYWTDSYKQKMYDSRILTTRNLVDALPENPDFVLVSTSAVGYYGSRGDEILAEDAPPGDDFLAELGKDWEAEAEKARKKGARVAIPRFGIVLGKNGGAMKQMVPVFKLGLGGSLADGRQWFPWIHIQDLVAAVDFALENKAVSGPFNLTAPDPVRNKEFTRILADHLNRPAFMPAPGFMIRTVMGEFGDTLLASTRAVPEKLLEYGFRFSYPTAQAAVDQILHEESE